MSARWARVVRGLLAAVLATFVAALFHVAGGDAVPGVLAITISLTFSGLACIALAGPRLTLWRLSLSVGLSQLVFHALFSFGQGSGAVLSPAARGSMHDMMNMGGRSAAHLATATLSTTSVAGHGGMAGMQDLLPSTPLMWVSHAMAALVTIVAIRSSARTLAATAALTGFVARCLFAWDAPEPAPLRLVAFPRANAPRSRPSLSVVLRRGMRHRGPPLGLSAAF